MQQQRSQRKMPWRYIAAISVLALIAASIAIALRAADQAREQREQERIAAQLRWERANLSQYEMIVDKDGCRYNIRFHNESSAIRSVPISCSVPPTTVTRLFAIASHDGLIEELCDTRGCPCESVTSVRSQYDQLLGYPSHVVINVDLHPAWWKPDLWRHVIENRALPKCSIHTLSIVQVLQLTAE